MLEKKSIRENFLNITERINERCMSVGRSTDSVKLVVVTKGHPISAVKDAIKAGIEILAENYVQEAIQKVEACAGIENVEWHMIGHVQSRKAKFVPKYFSYLQSLDSLRLAIRLNRFAGELGIQLPVLLECNVSGEKSKYGWRAWEEEKWENLLEEISPVSELPNLEIKGIMTMPPFFENPELARPYFQLLRRLREFLSKQIPHINWSDLSMGMSADFEVAIEEGATMVRIGTAIMGPRN